MEPSADDIRLYLTAEWLIGYTGRWTKELEQEFKYQKHLFHPWRFRDPTRETIERIRPSQNDKEIVKSVKSRLQ